MDRRQRLLAIAVCAALCLGAAAAWADDPAATPESTTLGSPFSPSWGSSAYSPTVPISQLARPSGWLDPSRLHFSSETSFGSGFNGQTTGLQVFRMGYQFGAPLAMSVSVGNAFGSGNLQNGQFFLEGLDVAYRPFHSMLINVSYKDFRSPLQLQNAYNLGYGSGMFGRP